MDIIKVTLSQLSQTNMTRKNVPRGELARCKLLTILGCRLDCLSKFSETGLISLNLDEFSKLVVGLKCEPIRTLQKSPTSKISLANIIAQNEQNFPIWLWKIRQTSKFVQSNHSNGSNFRNYEPMGTLEGHTTS